MRDRRGYARTLTAGLSLALALFASGCLVGEGAEEDDAPKLAQEQASTAPAVTVSVHVAPSKASAITVHVAPSKVSATPLSDTQGLTDQNDADEPALPPENSEVNYDNTTAAHEQIGGALDDGVFFDPPPHPYTPPPQH
jgi:hypothetical protein